MKKTLVFMLILCLALAGAFAELIQVGPTARFNGSMTELDDWKSIDSYQFGADARLNLGFVGVSGNALINFDDMKPSGFDSIVALSYRLDAGLVDFEFGAGYGLNFVKGEEEWTVNGVELKDIASIFSKEGILLRGAMGVNLGGIGVSADYKIPLMTVVDMVKGEQETSQFKNGAIAISALINIF